MNTNKLKISYLLFLMTLFALVPAKSYAFEAAKTQEIFQEKAKEEELTSETVITKLNDSLGEDYYKTEVNVNKKEMRFKSLSEVINEKKQAKAQANVETADKEKKQDLRIDCKEMEYFEDRSELEARDDVKIISDKIYATADKAIYNKTNNTIKLINNVVLKKSNSTVEGDYMLIDLNEENALMDEPVTKMGNIVINAQEGYAYSDRIENLNGNISVNKKIEMELSSQGFTKYGRSINDNRLVDFSLKKERSKPYSFKTKEIVIRPGRDHDSLLMKDVDIYYNKRKVTNVSSIEFFTDKEMTYSEVNYPTEFGSLKGFGMYLGLGYTFKLPKTYTLRILPAITYGEDELGVGAIAKLKSEKVRLETGWASSTNNLIVDADWKITNKLKLDLGRHVYKSEWFNGGTRAGYIAELAYDDSYLVKELGDAVFRHRISAGYVADYKRHHQEDNMQDGYRYRYMAELSKPLKTIGSKEQDMFLSLSAVAQAMASVYSETGDTFGLVRVGPRIHSRVKRWNSTLQYTMGGVHGHSPYRFDEYRYGRQTIAFDESLILNRFVSIGYRGTLTPLKDNRKKDVLTENRLYAVVGPEDFKIAFSYDTIRQNMHFDCMFLLGSDDLDLRYEKLTIEDPDKLGKHQRRLSDKELYKVKVPEAL